MIHFEVLESPNKNAISIFKYFKNQVYIGKDSGDLWLRDPTIPFQAIILEVLNSSLIIHPQKNLEYYLLNGKRASNVRKILKEDTITIGKTKIKIIDFNESKTESKKEILDEKLKSLLEEGSNRIPLIEEITKRMS